MGKITETYRLIYKDKEEAIADLKSKDILDEDGNRKSFPTHNVVMDIKVPEAKATFDTDGNVLTPATWKAGYHVDVMDERLNLNFGEYRTFPKKAWHSFNENEKIIETV